MSPTLTPSSRMDRRLQAFLVLQGGVNAPPSFSADSEKIIKISLSSKVILTFVSLAEVGSSRLIWDPRNRNPFIPSLHLERPMNLPVRHHLHFFLRCHCERPTNPPYSSNQILGAKPLWTTHREKLCGNRTSWVVWRSAAFLLNALTTTVKLPHGLSCWLECKIYEWVGPASGHVC